MAAASLISILFAVLALRLCYLLIHALFLSPSAISPPPRKDYSTYGDIYLCKPNTVYLCDPHDTCTVLSSHAFRKTDMYRVFEYEGIPNVSTFTDPAEAQRRRRQLHPFFNNAYLTQMEPIMLQYGVQALKARWDALLANRKKVEVNYRYDTQLAMFDITGALVFGREFHALETSNLVYTKWVNNTLSYMLVSHYFPWVKRVPLSWLVRGLKQSYDDLVAFSQESIAIRQADLQAGRPKPADLLQALLDAEDPDSKAPMTAREVQAESIAMLVGGSESTSSVISWVIHFLLLYPEHLQAVVAETRANFAADHIITFNESKAKLPYLEACIYETLRYQPITLKGYYIPAGTEIATNKCAAHLHRPSWEDPDRFYPPRFLKQETYHETRRNMLSFAYGTRFCIGRNLAWAVMMVTLANLFKDYEVELPEDSHFGPTIIMPTKMGVATMPADPERDCRMVLSARITE
ncbi:cytochrome P450 monooxygenase helB3 [Aspergillus novofumigatus IBT 16806]|uniref:Putative cytochrome P450 monooxygenase n=1 Tax=Aspergillus novofumigatus (strain IBT 16806) TaxID=1392255 RepID=A0A2I1CJQ4_ASPN1|nr:putative cytochrome P450 monooxygenase [Aspergillus novofumigatus IBT 16806]PKX97852.1 putative cytochrome P450 monooxygenase [Aspergillus novofumigatus IBT 16806]